MKRIVTLAKLPERPAEGHKGLFGRVLVVGGSEGMLGAPILAGTAALKMGAGLVQVAMPKHLLPGGLAITPELIGLELENKQRSNPFSSTPADALVVGPGMGTSPIARRRVLLLIQMNLPAVLDADALNLLAAEKKWPKGFKASAVLTPHPGEMKRLGRLLKLKDVPSDDRGRIDVAQAAAKAFGQVIVLKGHRTVVTDGERTYLNRTGDSSLSKAGAGDVLSGMLGTLLAQQMDPFDAACTAVWIHGKAGEIAGARLGRRCVLARDVIESIPQAIAEYEAQF